MEATIGNVAVIQDRELLKLEVDAIFGLSSLQAENPQTPPNLNCDDLHAVVIWSEHAHFVAGSPALSSDHRHILNGEVSTEPFAPGIPPKALRHLGDMLGLSPPTISGGPTYVVPSNLHHPTSPAIDGSFLFVISSGSEDGSLVAQKKLQRPPVWELDEWKALTEGRLGPWAMAIHRPSQAVEEDGIASLEPVCICFSARRTTKAAEAGVWTREDHRGRRLAPTVVATWASEERLQKEILFYSTSKDNIASQSVARQLGLRPLGWLWKLHV